MKKKDDDEDKMDWAEGLMQIYKAFEKQVMVQKQKYNTITRYKDDVEMNMELANDHRMEDPLLEMPGYEASVNRKKIKKNGEGKGDEDEIVNIRPMYKSKPWSNRYGILPGYRWNAVDRSNGFETKKLLKQSQTKDRKRKTYKYTNKDM